MDQPPGVDDSRERAVSCEAVSTRPNPFDDSDISSRKRRRTSLSGASRSRSLDSIAASPDEDLPASVPSTQEDTSAMKVDADPTAPHTPERKLIEPQPPSEPRSSRVTINVRTPSRPLDTIPSTPSPPSGLDGVPDLPASTGDEVKISVEETEIDTVTAEVALDTPAASSSDTSSPPVEILSLDQDDDTDLENAHPQVTLLQGMQANMLPDPTADFPFHEHAETLPETIARLTQYMPTHDLVSKQLSEWIENYLLFAQTADHYAVWESYLEYRDLWQSIPDLTLFMINRKMPYPRGRSLREDIMNYFRWFAKLTAFFVEFDLKSLRHAFTPDQTRLPELASPYYVQALSLLSRKDESSLHASQLHNGEADWSYADELTKILSSFRSFHTNQGSSLAYLVKLAQMESELVDRFPKLTESLGMACCLISNLLRESFRRLQHPGTVTDQDIEQARGDIARCYQFYRTMSSTLSIVIEKHVNHLSQDAALSLITALTEIYQMSLATDRVVPAEIIKDHRQNHPPLALHCVPEAMAYHWRFTVYSKLIKSSQMQLRVMAVTSMCNDLVAFWRRYNEPGEEVNAGFLTYLADFLLKTGLVAYILGPTCHPEITIESSNIIGFLLVSRTYSNEHTDLLWQTVTSSQDPRVSDALIRMTSRIANLYTYESLLYLCEKLNMVPVEFFGPSTRDFCEQIFRQLPAKFPYERSVLDIAPYILCVRLIRQSSIFGSQSPVAHPELLSFSTQKFKELLTNGPDGDGRRDIYLDCLQDIAERSPTSLGSLCVISAMLRPIAIRELHFLTSEHNLTRLLVDELEAAIPAARAAGFPAVISGTHNCHRKELLMLVLLHQPSTINKDLGIRLWNMLVGSHAACREDRDAAWQILNNCMKRNYAENPFIATCFAEYLPTLPPECFCMGTLDFVREGVLPLVNDATSILLDDEDSSSQGGIEQLWRMILTAPPNTVERVAIRTLVNDVYMDSRSILSFPHYRARKVHLAVVNRCLKHMSLAASKLKSFTDGTASGDDEPMVIVASEQQILEQQRLFSRSLAILKELHRLHQAKAHFSAPDLRSLILDSPKDIEGESAELKYQSFDGDTQTEVKPLSIGKGNTAASLLASLREATGFTNYRIYYRGRPFVPQESDICKSLEDLQIHNGIILVKRELDVVTSPTSRVRPGASPVEHEILGHFDELWDYLTMEEELATEIYQFLSKLPADENILRAIKSPDTPYTTLFPPGMAFKSLYAVNAIRQYLTTQRKAATSDVEMPLNESDEPVAPYPDVLLRCLSLVVAAISDEEVTARCATPELQSGLSAGLVACAVDILQDGRLPKSASAHLNGTLLNRLVQILTFTLSLGGGTKATEQVNLALDALFECCSLSSDLRTAFCAHDAVPGVMAALLLNDDRVAVRRHTASVIGDKVANLASSENAALDFQKFFWPLIVSLIGPAVHNPNNCDEILGLALSLFKLLRASGSPILDFRQLLIDWGDLLMSYTTYEDVTQPDVTDIVAFNLIRLLHCILCVEDYPVERHLLPPSGFARRLFWKHLFPPFEKQHPQETIAPILFPNTRALLIDIIFVLIDHDSDQLQWLIDDLDELVPFYNDDDGEQYAYELVQQFDRSKAIRVSCGYVGLKNLSNTCYLNSLFTQLFMNVGFREFIVNATIQDSLFSQNLLFQTKKLFGFMQNSIRRAINPEDCVNTIKTYDDTQIDIHNQMDVDEFYNLLFDRWESQLLTAEAKRQFRSFYGGQLVQQVASKECDHISERLEPFSAIQCDIKGKNTLQESLQAYVDGEIMEGENKYKCSTCDRHVDAVKRACLKDIPNNLIFHLKRFDFNLRTLQRSKINDFFTFPNKVDMRPYTIEHLSDPSEDRPTDIFELVGVLVHSGTAESGHYYSYIRERPSSSASELWVEFNDDVVSSWDPSQMENSCFGGPDYRPPYENNGVVYDKTFSAYMLFYQRSSSLLKEQQVLQDSSLSSPLRVRLPDELEQHIQRENISLLRRHCLYDPQQVQFAQVALCHMKSMSGDECTETHEMEDSAIRMALSHLDQVAARAKDVPDLDNLLKRLNIMIGSCSRCSFAIYDYFNTRNEAFRALLQRNAEPQVRQGTSDLMMRALQSIKTHHPQQYGVPLDRNDGSEDVDHVIYGVVRMCRLLWDFFHLSLRSWHEVFGFMLSFAKLGHDERAAFLEQPFLRMLIQIISADPNLELPQPFARMITAVSRRLASRPPSYENILGLLEVLILPMHVPTNERGEVMVIDHLDERLEVENSVDGPFLFTRPEIRYLQQDWSRGQANIFVDKLIGINQNLPSTNAILGHLICCSRTMEEKIFRTLKLAITGRIVVHQVAPFLEVAAQVFCRYSTQSELIHRLIDHVSEQCASLQNAEGRAFFEFQRDIFALTRQNSGEPGYEVLLGGIERLPEWVPGLLGHSDSSVSSDVELFLQQNLFKFGTTPTFGDELEELNCSEIMVKTARLLGVRCLLFLRENYVSRNVPVGRNVVIGLERVIKECQKYFEMENPPNDGMSTEFIRQSQAVVEPLRRLTVDEQDEDGSDWNSSVCSEQVDSPSATNMPGVGVLIEQDLQ